MKILIILLVSFNLYAQDLKTTDYANQTTAERNPASLVPAGSGLEISPEKQAEIMQQLEKYKQHQEESSKLLKELEDAEN